MLGELLSAQAFASPDKKKGIEKHTGAQAPAAFQEDRMGILCHDFTTFLAP